MKYVAKDSRVPALMRIAVRDWIWSGCRERPVVVDWRIAAALTALAERLLPISYLSGSSLGSSGSTYSARTSASRSAKDLALEQAGRGLHSSTPPLVRAAPSWKCGLSLFSYIESAEPIAMCMSRYL